ncbi:MAG: hypothetical protein HYZ37_07830 [Candidatus Solibacter usitatus]|nr:hypothetical protein [Candidatus Solibacter usitatus]
MLRLLGKKAGAPEGESEGHEEIVVATVDGAVVEVARGGAGFPDGEHLGGELGAERDVGGDAELAAFEHDERAGDEILLGDEPNAVGAVLRVTGCDEDGGEAGVADLGAELVEDGCANAGGIDGDHDAIEVLVELGDAFGDLDVAGAEGDAFQVTEVVGDGVMIVEGGDESFAFYDGEGCVVLRLTDVETGEELGGHGGSFMFLAAS